MPPWLLPVEFNAVFKEGGLVFKHQADLRSKLGKIMKQRREKLGLAQKDVSKELGYVSSQFISNWERGISTPPTAALRTLCSLYQLDKKKIVKLYVEEYRKSLVQEMYNED